MYKWLKQHKLDIWVTLIITAIVYIISDRWYTEYIVRPTIEERMMINDVRDVHLMATIQRYNIKATIYMLEPLDFDERYWTYTRRR